MVNLPTNRNDVLLSVFMAHHRMDLETQGRERAHTIQALTDKGIKFDLSNVNVTNTVVAAHKIERDRLGRPLADFELNDLIGWAA